MTEGTIYLAARYSRREELCEYRKQLQAVGFDVQARWLNGKHQISDNGMPLGDQGESLVESNHRDADVLRTKFAQDDWEDVNNAALVISFTEPPRSKANRGGRHVEYGIALANGALVVVIGHRENIFHWLPQVEFFQTWDEFFSTLTEKKDFCKDGLCQAPLTKEEFCLNFKQSKFSKYPQCGHRKENSRCGKGDKK